ncbi:MAG: T9SS type A sorting domain-containing protein [Bacteroidales bacterium]
MGLKINISILLIFLFICHTSFSQINQPGFPHNINQPKTNIPSIILPPVDTKKLLEEDFIFEESKLKPLRFAQMIVTDISPETCGVWDTLDNGDKLWQLKISSPGAFSLSVVFDYFKVPQGAKLFIYNLKNQHILGAFTAQNNKKSNTLAIAPVKGDEIIIEYFEPKEVNFTGELHISSVGHDYKNIFNLLNNNEKNFGASGSCNVNINCPEGTNWQTIKKSVCKITFNGFLCSGALINNTKNDGTPYLLTANHCIDNAYDAENAIFYFNYESPNCDNIDGDYTQTLSGSTIKAMPPSKSLDFTLLELSEMPPPEYSPYYAGWSRDFADPSTVASIHHPSGDIKKITISNNGATTGNFGGVYTPNSHWWIEAWDIGTTEGGSSGSPLFDQNQRIIGDLTGGEASCSFNFNDYYQQLHRSWQDYPDPGQQLKTWLDPDSTGILFYDGYLPYDTIPSHLKAWVEDTLVHLKWNQIVNHENLNTFYIYRNNVKIDSTTNISYTDSTTFIDSTYQYQVTAKFLPPDNNESAASNKAYIKRVDTLYTPFYETFEDSAGFFNRWYQEKTNDTVGWVIQTGGKKEVLDTAYEGNFNAYFQNNNSESSRLVSPILNLSNGEHYLLNFYLHNPSSNDEVHQLDILYKETDSLQWKTIRSYNTDISVWQKKQVPLPNLSSNYRIAFKAIGLNGYGISIDSISITEDFDNIDPQIIILSDTLCLNDSILIATDLDKFHDLQWDFGKDAVPQQNTGPGPHWVKYNTIGVKEIALMVNNTYDKVQRISVYNIPEKPLFTVEENTLTSSSAINNQWYLNNVPIPGATQKTYTIETDGEYAVAVTNFAGCTVFSDPQYLVVTSNTEHLKEIIQEQTEIKIYPNPNQGEFAIEIVSDKTQFKKYFYKVLDVTGSLIDEGTLQSNLTQIKLKNNHAGIYFLQIISAEQSKTYKILIKK